MAEIAVNELAVKAASALTTSDQVMTFTQDGDTNRTPLFEAVSKANEENDIAVSRFHTEDWGSATVLAAVSASPVPITIGRAAGQTIVIQASAAGMSGDVSTPYDTNVTIAIRYVGADEPILTCQVLDRTVTGAVPMSLNTSAAVGNTVIVNDADLEWYVQSGAALNGTGDLVIDLIVTLI
jgi:hypothetical protein